LATSFTFLRCVFIAASTPERWERGRGVREVEREARPHSPLLLLSISPSHTRTDDCALDDRPIL